MTNTKSRRDGEHERVKKTLKKMTPLIAIVLVIVMVINTVWVSAAQVSIQRIESKNPEGTANNYLIDSTSYMTEDTLQRMYEVLLMTQTPSDWRGYEEQAGIYIAREQYDKAIECIGKAVEISTEASDLEKASLWLKKGCLYVIQADYENALDALQQCVVLDPKCSEGYLIMAQIYLEREDETNTLKNMESYLELNPGNTEAEEMVAQLYMAKSDFVTAKKWLQRAIESGGGAQIYYQYALCTIQENNFEEAIEYLNKTLELDENVKDAYYYRGICRLTMGEYVLALEDLKIAEEKTEDPELQSEITKLIGELTNG